MKSINFILILFFLLPLYIQAQINYLPGFIITNDGDTTHGLIKYKNPKRINQGIKFRKDKSASPVNYSPGEITGFQYSGSGYYISHEVVLDSVTQTFFLEFLVEGEANLYFLRDRKEFHYFIERNGIVELKNDEEKVTIGNKNYIRTKEQFRQTLKDQLYESEKTQEEVKSIDFDHDNLIDLAKTFHDDVCTDENKECIVYEKDIRSSSYIGLEFEQFYPHLDNQYFFFPGVSQEYTAKSPERSIMLIYSNSNLFGLTRGSGFQIGLGYSTTNISSERYEIAYKHFLVPIYYTHRFWTNKFSPFARAGLKNYFSINKSVKNIITGEPSIYDNLIGSAHFGGQVGLGLLFQQGDLTFYLSAIREIRISSKGVGLTLGGALEKTTGNSINFGFKIGL